MGIFNKVKQSLRNAVERFKESRHKTKTEKVLRRAAREIKEAHKKDDDMSPGLIDVASVYSKGRNRRSDIRHTQRVFKAKGRKLVLINRPGTIVERKGARCFVTNKGKFIPFAVAED